MFIIFKRWISCFCILPILLALTACNDSNDDQSKQHDQGKKPVMRCAP